MGPEGKCLPLTTALPAGATVRLGSALIHHANGMYTRADDPGEPTTGKPRVSVTEDECRVLTWLAHGRRVLEIGTGLGVSTRAMSKSARYLLTVDPDPWVQREVWPTLCCEKDSTLAGYYEQTIPAYFDLAFIDGDHEEEAVMRDIRSVLPLLDEDGLIVLHDTNLEGVRRAAESFGTLVRMDTKGHLGMLWVRR